MVYMLIFKSYRQTYESYLTLSGVQPSRNTSAFGPESLIYLMLFEGEMRQ